jgi:hypothetical protein
MDMRAAHYEAMARKQWLIALRGLLTTTAGVAGVADRDLVVLWTTFGADVVMYVQRRFGGDMRRVAVAMPDMWPYVQPQCDLSPLSRSSSSDSGWDSDESYEAPRAHVQHATACATLSEVATLILWDLDHNCVIVKGALAD